MKFLRALLFLFLLPCMSLYAQSETVSFIHGFGSTSSVWNTMNSDLSQDYSFNSYNVSYNTAQSIGTSASSVYIPNGSVAVAHSQGGLLAREYLRRTSTSNLDALITVGTPNLGAPIINGAQAGNLQTMLGYWIDDLAAGPSFVIGSQASAYVNGVLNALKIIGSNALDDYIDDLTASATSITQMKPGSSFLNTLNSSPSSTLPTARYAIFGSETQTMNNHIRLADSFRRNSVAGNPIESGTGVDIHGKVKTVYLIAANTARAIASYYFWLYTDSDTFDPNRLYYYDRYTYYSAASDAFAWGWLSLELIQHIEWESYMVGSNLGNGTLIESDAFIPADYQAPSFFGQLGDRILRSEGANHVELTAHESTRNRLAEIFEKNDVQIPEVQPPSLPNVTISGSTGMMQGQSSTFTANASDGTPPYSYQWYYKHENDSNWSFISGATGSSYNHTAGAPNGEYLKVVVTDSQSQSDDDQHYITIFGMGF